MSERYPGGYITKNAPQPTGGESGVADGVWTLEQALEYKQAGNWPIPIQPVYVEDVFSTYLYDGTGSAQTFTNGIDLSTKGGLVWIKARSGTEAVDNHIWTDTVRGNTKNIYSNLDIGQTTSTIRVTAFNTNGFSIGTEGSVNNSTTKYASWTFRKAEKFFDVVTWTGNGASERAINHNLGSVPGFVVVKCTSTSGDWWVAARNNSGTYHRSDNSSGTGRLNTTGPLSSALNLAGLGYLTSTTFIPQGVTGGVLSESNTNGATYVAYLFAHDAGGFGDSGSESVIKCGSFVETGSTFVNLGWEPQWILVRDISAGPYGNNWYVVDNMRGLPASGSSAWLAPNLANAESSGNIATISSTGFTALLNSGAGDTYIYIAIRRGPMKTPTDATTVFDADAWTGNNTTGRNIPTGFPVDLTIAQIRTAIPVTQANLWWDRLRGYGSTSSITGNYLRSQNTDAEFPLADYMYIPTMDGFNFGSVANNSNQYNSPDVTAVGWNFRRAPGFFDVVCGTGPVATAYHNLGVIPEMIIMKRRNGTDPWWVVSSGLGSINADYILLNTNAAKVTESNNLVNATSTTFSPQYFFGGGNTWVAYLFATLAGVSKVGSYTGTGTTQQINCGFTGGARFVLIKRTDSTGDWYVWDSARGIVAGNDPYLLLNSTAAEVTNTDYIDTYSLGFEISSTAPAAINANGGTFIYLAIA